MDLCLQRVSKGSGGDEILAGGHGQTHLSLARDRLAHAGDDARRCYPFARLRRDAPLSFGPLGGVVCYYTERREVWSAAALRCTKGAGSGKDAVPFAVSEH